MLKSEILLSAFFLLIQFIAHNNYIIMYSLKGNLNYLTYLFVSVDKPPSISHMLEFLWNYFLNGCLAIIVYDLEQI